MENLRALLTQAAETAARYLETLDDRGVRPTPEALAGLEELNEPLAAESMEPERILETLDRIGSPATVGMAGRRFFGFVIGGSLPAALAANWLAAAWDQNPAFVAPTPGVARLEQIALTWLNELFELPPDTTAGFVSGATVSNFTALAAARHAVLARAGWNVESDGLFGAPPITVVVGGEAHPSLTKSLGMLGLGRSRLVRVAVDSQGRMRADALPAMKGPTICCLQAGNVNTGACDAFAQLIPRAHEQGAWVHVDGAFGLWAKVSARYRALVDGVELADSWATDAHKWLNVPYDSGVAFVRDPQSLAASMAVTADYLPGPGAERSPCD